MSAEDCVGCRHINNCLGDCVGYEKVKPQEQTNEEWLKQANTEQLAEQITDIVWECKDQDDCMDCRLGWCSKDYVVEWLKQPHKE